MLDVVVVELMLRLVPLWVDDAVLLTSTVVVLPLGELMVWCVEPFAGNSMALPFTVTWLEVEPLLFVLVVTLLLVAGSGAVGCGVLEVGAALLA